MPQATRAAAAARLELETRQQRAIKTGAACNIIESNLRQEVPYPALHLSLSTVPAPFPQLRPSVGINITIDCHCLPPTHTHPESGRTCTRVVCHCSWRFPLLYHIPSPCPRFKVNACCERKSLSSAVAVALVDQLHLKHIIIL